MYLGGQKMEVSGKIIMCREKKNIQVEYQISLGIISREKNPKIITKPKKKTRKRKQ